MVVVVDAMMVPVPAESRGGDVLVVVFVTERGRSCVVSVGGCRSRSISLCGMRSQHTLRSPSTPDLSERGCGSITAFVCLHAAWEEGKSCN